MDLRIAARLGAQVLAVAFTVKALRQARDEGDRLQTFDAAVHGLAVASAVALIVREIRRNRAEKHTFGGR